MKRKPRDFDIFSLSFLDVVSCGFGAVVSLVLLAANADLPALGDSPPVKRLLARVLASEASNDALGRALSAERERGESQRVLLDRLRRSAQSARASLRARESETRRLAESIEGLEVVRSSLKRAALSADTAETRDEEVGGIPVDSDYVVFIIDTSGSMQSIWGQVTAQVENVIRIHPEVEGFQILNDNGKHLISAYAGKWIPDTPRRRESAIRLLRTWGSLSNSSPVEGLEVALRTYAKPGRKVSIYIFGDEYSGSSYDPVIDTLTELNADRTTGEPLARIHAVGFLSELTDERFPILMREVARRNGGTFVALPY